MTYLNRLANWGDTHHSKWLDIVRVALGIFLCYKAISFLANMSELQGILGRTNMGSHSFAVLAIGHIIVIIHFLGGLFIALGLHTRLACLVQIPILIGAIVLLSVVGDNVSVAEVAQSSIVLLLLIVFLIEGNGPWSYDNLFREEDKTNR